MNGKLLLVCACLAGLVQGAMGQHLWWKPNPTDATVTCMYGEIDVLATNPHIYYCGCTWWPGQPAGGYTGIQDQGGGVHNMIFSIWDTSPTLHPSVTEADPATVFNRFGGEGTGAHTHLNYPWVLGKTYRYYVTKEQDATKANTLTRVYFLDDTTGKWVHEATISNPNDGGKSVPTFGGGLNGFLENWMGEDRAAPKLALYRLWMGPSLHQLVNVDHASGDGDWGVLNGSFYLAEGDSYALTKVFDTVRNGKGEFVRSAKRGEVLTVPTQKIPRSVLRALEHLPRAPAVAGLVR